MKTRIGLMFLKVILVVIFTIGIVACKKDTDDPTPNPAQNDSIAWVVGSIDSTGYGLILKTEDGGISWNRQGEGEAVFQNVGVNNLYVLDKNNVWVVCDDNRIAKTTDGGLSWKQILIPTVNPGNEIQCISIVNNNNIWISGGNGYVASSTNDGNSWTMYDTVIFNSRLCQGICAINSQLVYVVANDASGKGDIGLIRRTLDGGASWENIELVDNYDGTTGWIGVSATDLNHVIVYAGKGRYAYTVDGGTSWVNDSMIIAGGGGPADINHLIMLDQTSWWAALDLDHIIFTSNSGSLWTEQPTAGSSNQFLVGIDAYDSNLALITGQSASIPWGKILRTTDSGTKWTSVLEGSTNLFKVSFVPK